MGKLAYYSGILESPRNCGVYQHLPLCWTLSKALTAEGFLALWRRDSCPWRVWINHSNLNTGNPPTQLCVVSDSGTQTKDPRGDLTDVLEGSNQPESFKAASVVWARSWNSGLWFKTNKQTNKKHKKKTKTLKKRSRLWIIIWIRIKWLRICPKWRMF